MKAKAILLNCLKYDKDTKTRIGFVIIDNKLLADNERYKGVGELSVFYNNPDVFDKLSSDMMLEPLEITLKQISNYRNPLKTTLTIEAINFNGHNISLL